jgi:hypothetical protein
VTASWIGASAPGGALHVMAASGVDAGVTYANGKWRRIALRLPPGAGGRLRVRLHPEARRAPVALAVDDVVPFVRGPG